MRKVLVIDTSVLCVWLKVPGKETCGPSNALVTYEMVSEKIEEEKKKRTTFILPLATIIETGNHIAHTSGDKKSLGEEFAQIMIDSADEKSPWAAFTEQSSLWNPENLKKLAEKWKDTVIGAKATFDYFKQIQQRIISFVSQHSKIEPDRMEKMMMNTKMLTKDLGTVLVGKEAVKEGIIDEVGGISSAYHKIYELMKKKPQIK